MDKTVNPLRKYLDETGENVLAFSRKCKLPPTTVYDIYKGRIPNRSTAIQICRHTQGKIKPEDFGWIKLCSDKNRYSKNIHRRRIKRAICGDEENEMDNGRDN